jgi:hypothetical protein
MKTCLPTSARAAAASASLTRPAPVGVGGTKAFGAFEDAMDM